MISTPTKKFGKSFITVFVECLMKLRMFSRNHAHHKRITRFCLSSKKKIEKFCAHVLSNMFLLRKVTKLVSKLHAALIALANYAYLSYSLNYPPTSM